MGERMVTRLVPGLTASMEENEKQRAITDGKQPESNSFMLPKADVHGFCNNHYWASFMEDADSECTANVNLEDECKGSLNPINFQRYLEVFAGSDTASGAKTIPITIGDIYTYDTKELTYRKDGSSSITSSRPGSEQGCPVCYGAIYEIAYTVYTKLEIEPKAKKAAEDADITDMKD